MKAKLRILSLVLCLLLLGAAASAATRYCPLCEKDTEWEKTCAANKAVFSWERMRLLDSNADFEYYTHTVDGMECKWRVVYCATAEICTECRKNFYAIDEIHAHAEEHDACGAVNCCPYDN